jgi:hypothetical protein
MATSVSAAPGGTSASASGGRHGAGTSIEDGAPRLDQVPLERAAAILGIRPSELRELKALGWELFDERVGDNNYLMTPAELAEECGITTRQLRNLEPRGLPSVGDRKAKRYPWPLAEEWYRVFTRRSRDDRGVAIPYLDPREATAEFNRALELIRAYNFITLRNEEGELDPPSRERIGQARDLLRRGLVPAYHGAW